MRKYDRPVYINRRYADILILPAKSCPGNRSAGTDKFSYGKANDPQQPARSAEIVSDLYINTLEEEAMPFPIYLTMRCKDYRMLMSSLNETEKRRGWETIREVWEKANPGEYFTYIDVIDVFINATGGRPIWVTCS